MVLRGGRNRIAVWRSGPHSRLRLTPKTHQYPASRGLFHLTMVLSRWLPSKEESTPAFQEFPQDFHSIAELGELFGSESFEVCG